MIYSFKVKRQEINSATYVSNSLPCITSKLDKKDKLRKFVSFDWSMMKPVTSRTLLNTCKSATVIPGMLNCLSLQKKKQQEFSK